jgi:hypothetical protein
LDKLAELPVVHRTLTVPVKDYVLLEPELA